MFRTILLTLCATLLLTGAAVAGPADLGVGDKAPVLESVNWLKGAPVPQFERGKIYVIDFWATWCGPCLRSIPQVNEMAERYRDDGVSVIGLAIWPNDRMTPTDEYVESRGDDMDYIIAEDIDGRTAKAYMEASGSNGIPTAMVIDRSGSIAWIGHPMAGLEDVVKEVVDGTFDVAAHAERRRIEKEKQELLRKAQEQARKAREQALPHILKLNSAMTDENWEEVIELSETIVAVHESLGGYSTYKYQGLLRLERSKDAAAYGRKVVMGAMKEQAVHLNGLAWTIVDPQGFVELDQRDLELAAMAIKRADELTEHKEANVLDTLARVHFAQGNLARALTIQLEAVELSEGLMRDQLQKTLDEYEDAAGS